MSAAFRARCQNALLALRDGSVLMTGGTDGGNIADSWLSTNEGRTWTQHPTPAWSGRYGHAMVQSTDGSVLLIAGYDGSYRSDIWRSTDRGGQWERINDSAPFTGRTRHGACVHSTGTLLVMGGDTTGPKINDVWASSDNGRTWSQRTGSAGWETRELFGCVALPSGNVVVIAGNWSRAAYANDVWNSSDKGASWACLTSSAPFGQLYGLGAGALRDGSLIICGGSDGSSRKSHSWRSTDGGRNWSQVSSSGPWDPRVKFGFAVTAANNLLVVAGDWSRAGYAADAWLSNNGGSTWTAQPASLETGASAGTVAAGGGPVQRVMRYSSTSTGAWGYGSTPDAISFTVSRPVAIHGCILYGNGSMSVEMSLREGNNSQSGTVLSSTSTSYSVANGSTADIRFPSPAVVRPGTTYTLVTLIRGSSSQYGSGTVQNPSVDGVVFSFSNTSGGNNGTDVVSGNIPGLLFSTDIGGGGGGGSQAVVTRFPSTESLRWSLSTIDAIGVELSATTTLSGVGLYGGQGEYRVTVRVRDGPHSETSPEIYSHTGSFTCHDNSVTRFPFPSGVTLQAGRRYTIVADYRATESGRKAWCGQSGRDEVTEGGVRVRFIRCDGPDNGTSVSSGQIPALYLGSGSASGGPWTWDSQNKSARFTLSEGDTVARVTDSSQGTDAVRGTLAMSQGRHTWVIRLQSGTGTNTMVGVCRSGQSLSVDRYTDLIGESQTSWGWKHDGAMMHNGSRVGSASAYSDGSEMKLVYDAGAGTLELFLGSSSSPSGRFTGVSPPVYPVVSTTFRGGIFRIVSSGGGPVPVPVPVPSPAPVPAAAAPVASYGTAPWTKRRVFESVVTLDGRVVVMGGNSSGPYLNDVWQSSDRGATWSLLGNAAWSARCAMAASVLRDGRILMTGGYDRGYKNDVWSSADGGRTWTCVNAAAPWAARMDHAQVSLPDGSVLVMGGDSTGPKLGDVWRSTDGGASWNCIAQAAPWGLRDRMAAVEARGAVLLIGGRADSDYKDDVWRSTDGGASWNHLGSTPWHGRHWHRAVPLPDGSVIFASGNWSQSGYAPDVWRSTDLGTSWSAIAARSAWPPRDEFGLVAFRDNGVLLMGGHISESEAFASDVWYSDDNGANWSAPVPRALPAPVAPVPIVPSVVVPPAPAFAAPQSPSVSLDDFSRLRTDVTQVRADLRSEEAARLEADATEKRERLQAVLALEQQVSLLRDSLRSMPAPGAATSAVPTAALSELEQRLSSRVRVLEEGLPRVEISIGQHVMTSQQQIMQQLSSLQMQIQQQVQQQVLQQVLQQVQHQIQQQVQQQVQMQMAASPSVLSSSGIGSSSSAAAPFASPFGAATAPGMSPFGGASMGGAPSPFGAAGGAVGAVPLVMPFGGAGASPGVGAPGAAGSLALSQSLTKTPESYATPHVVRQILDSELRDTSQLVFRRILGQGCNGMVIECELGVPSRSRLVSAKGTPLTFVVKVLYPMGMTSLASTRMMGEEFSLVSGLNHPNLIRVYRHLHGEAPDSVVQQLDPSLQQFAYERDLGGQIVRKRTMQFVVMERHPETLESKWRRLASSGRVPVSFSDPQLMFMIWQVVSAFAYLDSQRIEHRDIKLDNLLVAEDGSTVVLTDFDMGVRREPDGTFQLRTAGMAAHGNPLHTPPEVLTSLSRQTSIMAPIIVLDFSKQAVWSVGTLLWEMLTGMHPYGQSYPSEFTRPYDAVEAGRSVRYNVTSVAGREPVRQLLGDFPEGLRTTLLRMIDNDPAQRPTMREVHAVFERELMPHVITVVSRCV